MTITLHSERGLPSSAAPRSAPARINSTRSIESQPYPPKEKYFHRSARSSLVRAPAFHPDIIPAAAAAISTAFSEANRDQEVGVKLVRKEKKMGVFHTKYLTSFIAYMNEGYLYLLLSRVDWPIPQAKENDKLPEPRRDRVPMNFRVVSGDYLFYAGPRSLEIAWQDPIFGAAYRLPGLR